ncbi:MFS transporter [Neobacillus sp. LXY-4]|uniref:MFS transporter n=1 Tax=Neobacillus sp. LXY-4 TaxID=3379826 RepID=UPI003EDFFC7F
MRSKIGNKRWGIIILLSLCYLVLYMDRSNMSMAGSSMMEYYGWNSIEFGLASTAFFIGYAITQMPGGRLADRFGGGKIVMIGAFVWSIFVFITPLASTLSMMLLIRMFMGLGEGVALPAIHSILAKWIPKKETGKATGFVQAGLPIGIAITMPLATWIIQTWNWQMVFYSFSFVAIIWCMLWWKFGKDSPELHPRISETELAYIQQDQDSHHYAFGSEGLLTKKEIISTKSVWFCALSYFCANYLFFLFMTWLPNYFVIGRGINLHSSAFYSMLPYLVAIFTYPFGGYLADAASKKFGQNIGRKLFPIIGLSIAGILLILGSKATSVGAAVVLISASNGFLTLTMGGFFTMPMVFSQKNAGMITGVFTTLGTIAGILAPFMTGLIIELSGKYEYALYIGALVAMIGAVILMTICRVEPIVSKSSKEDMLVDTI